MQEFVINSEAVNDYMEIMEMLTPLEETNKNKNEIVVTHRALFLAKRKIEMASEESLNIIKKDITLYIRRRRHGAVEVSFSPKM